VALPFSFAELVGWGLLGLRLRRFRALPFQGFAVSGLCRFRALPFQWLRRFRALPFQGFAVSVASPFQGFAVSGCLASLSSSAGASSVQGFTVLGLSFAELIGIRLFGSGFL
jgi:hypothetical protein